MNLKDLRYLVAVADHRHFGRAAEACFVSQPTLSTQLKKLEQELGVELIERSPRQVMLTAVGDAVVERARVVLRETDNIRDVARRATDPEAGTLRLGLFPTLAPYLLPHIVPTLHERFPNLELLLVEEKSAVVHERLRTGQLDVGLLAMPVHDDHLQCRPLFSEEFVLAVPADHPLAHVAGPVSTSVLAGDNVLLLEEGHCLRDQALSYCQHVERGATSSFGASSLSTIIQMVANGLGITLLPELSLPFEVHDPRIALLAFAPPEPVRTVALAWRRSSPRKRDFVELARLLSASRIATASE